MIYVITCEADDEKELSVLIEGCRAHSEFEAEPFPLIGLYFNHIRVEPVQRLEGGWVLFFGDEDALKTFAGLMATIDFKKPDFVRILKLDNEGNSETVFSMARFHKFVFHDSEA